MNELRQLIRKLVSEAIETHHYKQRIYDRFINSDIITVGYENVFGKGNYIEVGTYTIPQQLKDKILKADEIIKKYDFPKDKEFLIKVADVSIDRKKVNYYNEDLKKMSLRDNRPPILLILDNKTKSYGNQIFVVVADNTIITSYLAPSYIMNIKLNKNAIRADKYIENINDLIV